VRCFSFSSFEEKFTRQLRIFFVVSASEPRIQTKTLNQLKSKAPSSPAPPCLSLTAPLPHKEASTSEREREREYRKEKSAHKESRLTFCHTRERTRHRIDASRCLGPRAGSSEEREGEHKFPTFRNRNALSQHDGIRERKRESE